MYHLKSKNVLVEPAFIECLVKADDYSWAKDISCPHLVIYLDDSHNELRLEYDTIEERDADFEALASRAKPNMYGYYEDENYLIAIDNFSVVRRNMYDISLEGRRHVLLEPSDVEATWNRICQYFSDKGDF